MITEPDEISLQEIWQTLWSRRGLIIGLALIVGVIAFATAFLLPEKYQATVVLVPVDDESGGGKLGGASALLSQFGGLAGLGGVSLGGSSKKAEAVATLQSAALTQVFIAEKQLLPVLYHNKWDAANGKWKVTDPKKIPTLWRAERKFLKQIRSVSEDKKTGLITLTITWIDPENAAAWANELVVRTNRYLRTKAIEQSQKNLGYLNEQLTKSSVLELQKAIYGLIESEIKKVMIANGSDEYAFKVIDPARVPEERSSPKRALIAVVGILTGLMIGMALAFALPRRRR